MSTNYYLVHPQVQSIHIGKSSLGWQFLFEAVDVGAGFVLDTFDRWMDYIQDSISNRSARIEDEYGREVSLIELRDLIIQKQQTGKNYWTAGDDYLSPVSACNRVKGDSGENYDRKGFRFSKHRNFS